jgi:8-oxo-dGTP pyrophosphatase MutT (NUDIX family)
MEETLNSTGDSTKCPVALIISNDKILLGHRHYTPDKWKPVSVWTCHGGRCDAGETIETTLKREVYEETGISEMTIEEYLGDYPGSKAGDLVPVFLCRTDQEPKNMEPEKFSEWKWFGKDNFPDIFINNEIGKLIKTLL